MATIRGWLMHGTRACRLSTGVNDCVLLTAQMATKRVHMFNAVKVLMAFSKPFWPDGFFDAVCTGEGRSLPAAQLPCMLSVPTPGCGQCSVVLTNLFLYTVQIRLCQKYG